MNGYVSLAENDLPGHGLECREYLSRNSCRIMEISPHHQVIRNRQSGAGQWSCRNLHTFETEDSEFSSRRNPIIVSLSTNHSAGEEFVLWFLYRTEVYICSHDGK